MDILEDYCIMRNYGYSRLDGQMNIADRQEEVSTEPYNTVYRLNNQLLFGETSLYLSRRLYTRSTTIFTK